MFVPPRGKSRVAFDDGNTEFPCACELAARFFSCKYKIRLPRYGGGDFRSSRTHSRFDFTAPVRLKAPRDDDGESLKFVRRLSVFKMESEFF